MARRGIGRCAGAALAALISSAGVAHAQVDTGRDTQQTRATDDRAYGVAELGLGWLVLPGADVCTVRGTGACSKGDTSPTLEVWPLYRASQLFAFGAGVTLGLIPTTDAPRQDPAGVTRDHTRGYLNVEATARYYPFVGENFEAWVGLIGGLVVVSDTYKPSSGTNDKALVGPRGVVIRSEGYSIGIGTGVAYKLGSHWAVGGVLRYGSWFLPITPAKDPLGDEASLTGQNVAFGAGVNIAYRTAL